MTELKMTDKKTEKKNPYLDAARAWNDYFASLTGARNIWLAFAFVSLCIALAAVAGVIYIGGQSKYIPYVIEVDKLGHVQYEGVIPQYHARDAKVIQLLLMDFVTDLRGVTLDAQLQKQFLDRLYAKMLKSSNALKKVSDYFTSGDHNPLVRGRKVTVGVTVTSLIPMTEETYSIEWIETVRDNANGLVASTSNYKGNFTLEFRDMGDALLEDIRKNPLGLYVKDFSFQQLR